MEDNYSKFSRVVDNYRRYRPHYPHGIIDVLEAKCALSSGHVVADIGSGTGLLTELFLKNGNRVYGVEPNPDMRLAAEEQLQPFQAFTSIAGTAEATTLPDQSVHMITAGQAFHWFDHEHARQEFSRILMPGGWVILIWNLERNDDSPFARAYEQFWRTYINPEADFRRRKRPDYIVQFFGANNLHETGVDNYQSCDLEALKGRILSGSNTPPPDDPRYADMIADLTKMFDQYQQDGRVTIKYDTRIVYGQLSV